MKKALLPLLLCSTTSFASEPVRTFAELIYLNFDDVHTTGAGVTHYFADQSHLGAFDEFGYLDTDSSFSAGYAHTSSDFIGEIYSSTYVIDGEYITNNFLIGGTYQNTSNDYFDSSSKNIRFGYFLQENLVVKALYSDKTEDFYFSGQYSHQLAGNDYFGVTLDTDQELNYVGASSTYFTHLGGDNYLRLGLDVSDITEFDLDHSLFYAAYYFNAGTNVSLSATTDDWEHIGVKYFYQDNAAFFVDISNDSDNTMTFGLSGHW